MIEDYVHKSDRYINSDKELFIAQTQERMKNLIGKSATLDMVNGTQIQAHIWVQYLQP